MNTVVIVLFLAACAATAAWGIYLFARSRKQYSPDVRRLDYAIVALVVLAGFVALAVHLGNEREKWAQEQFNGEQP